MARVPAQRTRGLPACLRRGTLGHRRGGGNDRRQQDAPEGSRAVRRYHLSACAVTVDEDCMGISLFGGERDGKLIWDVPNRGLPVVQETYDIWKDGHEIPLRGRLHVRIRLTGKVS